MAEVSGRHGNVPPDTREETASSVRKRRRHVPSLSFVLLALAVIATGSGAVVWVLARPEPRSIEIIIPTPGPLVVHVTGSVNSPGVFTLPPGSRTSDAVNAAGGLSEPSAINLAAPLRDGQQLVVTAISKTEDTPAGTAIHEQPALLLDLNTASGSQLEQLPNIGPSRAAAIIDFRVRNGPILFVDDLTAIDGIGPATVDRLRALVVQP